MERLLLFVLLVVKTTSKLIDLSHDHGPNTLMSPLAPHFNRSNIFAGDYLPVVYLEAGQYSSGEHGGTHLDAPMHLQQGGQQHHQIPLENTIAEGVMIDCSAEAAANHSYLVLIQKVRHQLEKLLDWEKALGQIPMQAAVIFNFGWSPKFDDPPVYLGGNVDDQFTFVFPAVGTEAGVWLYDYRYTKIIGTDTISPDPLFTNGAAVTSFPVHQKYLPKIA